MAVRAARPVQLTAVPLKQQIDGLYIWVPDHEEVVSGLLARSVTGVSGQQSHSMACRRLQGLGFLGTGWSEGGPKAWPVQSGAEKRRQGHSGLCGGHYESSSRQEKPEG